jgi:hypothetical protein
VRVFVANRLASAARDFFWSLGLKQHHIQGGRGVKASQIKPADIEGEGIDEDVNGGSVNSAIAKVWC